MTIHHCSAQWIGTDEVDLLLSYGVCNNKDVSVLWGRGHDLHNTAHLLCGCTDHARVRSRCSLCLSTARHSGSGTRTQGETGIHGNGHAERQGFKT